MELFLSFDPFDTNDQTTPTTQNSADKNRLTLRQGPQNNVTIDAYIHDLAKLRLDLDIAKSKNEDSLVIMALENDYQRKENDALQIIPKDELYARLKSEISRRQTQQNKTAKVINDDKNKQATDIISATPNGERIVLNPITPGEFTKYERDGSSKVVNIAKPFEMMATETTQIIWKKIALLGKQKFGYKLVGDPSKEKGDILPVTNVSMDDTVLWFKILNHLAKENIKELYDIIPDHKGGSHYRLPTAAEFDFVLSNRGQLDNESFYKDTTHIGKLAWTLENSDSQPHSVAQKIPLVVEGREFFDLLGNVEEWVDSPQGKANSRGGAYVFLSGSSNFHQGSLTWTADEAFNYIGFRIVREMRKP